MSVPPSSPKITEKIGEIKPRFVTLSESAAEHPHRGIYAGGLFIAALLPLSLVAQLIGPALAIIGYLLGMSLYGVVREAQRGDETPATLVWRTISGRHLALGQLYVLDHFRAVISSRRG